MTFVKITMDPPSTGSGQAAQNTAVMTLGFLIKYQTSNLLMLLTLLYLLTNTSLWAADTLKVERPHPVNEPWRWTEFDRTSGLAGRVRSIYEDRDGNIWFATDRGAQRYDGRTWTTYTTEDGLASNSVAGVYQTRDGAYWFPLRAGGISRFDPSRGSGKAAWTTYRVGRPAGVSTAEERRLETAEDSLLAGCFWGGNHLHETRDGTLWAGTASPAGGRGGIMRFDPSTALPPSRGFGGQSRTGGTAWALVPGPAGQPLPSVTDIHETRDGMLWFAAGKDGVLRLDPSSGAWIRYTQTDGLGEAAGALLEDESGTLWVFGSGGTQHRFDGRRWHSYSSDVRERFGRASLVFNGVPWAITPDDELCYFDGTSWQCASIEDVPDQIGSNARSAIWYYRGDIAKAYRFDTGPGRWTGYQGVRTLHSIHSDDALFAIGDDIWLTSPDGVVRYDGTHFIQYSAEDGLIDGQVTTVLEGRDGSIWVAGRHKGEAEQHVSMAGGGRYSPRMRAWWGRTSTWGSWPTTGTSGSGRSTAPVTSMGVSAAVPASSVTTVAGGRSTPRKTDWSPTRSTRSPRPRTAPSGSGRSTV